MKKRRIIEFKKIKINMIFKAKKMKYRVKKKK